MSSNDNQGRQEGNNNEEITQLQTSEETDTETVECYGCETVLGDDDTSELCCGCNQTFCTECATASPKLTKDHPVQRDHDQGYYNGYVSYCNECTEKFNCNGCDGNTDPKFPPRECEVCDNQYCTICVRLSICFTCRWCWNCLEEEDDERSEYKSRICIGCKFEIEESLESYITSSDVVALIIQFASIQTIDEERDIRVAKETKRQVELEQALHQVGLNLRQDSKLCTLYIQGKTDLTTNDIVPIMQEMKFFHEETDYVDQVDKEINSYRKQKGYFCIEECQESAKSTALATFAKKRRHEGLSIIPPSLRTSYEHYCEYYDNKIIKKRKVLDKSDGANHIPPSKS